MSHLHHVAHTMIAHEPLAAEAEDAVEMAEAAVDVEAEVDDQVAVDVEAEADDHPAAPMVNGNALATGASHHLRHHIQIAAE